MINRYGLNRNIGEEIKLQIRRNCSFSCVICGSGFYHYEHIDPEFHDAQRHDPDRIACLCANHHDQVTRGTMSKATVAKAYEIRKASVAAGILTNPIGPLDLNCQWPSIQVARLHYTEGLPCLLRYMGEDIIYFERGDQGEPAKIFADIYDSDGDLLFKIKGNEWIGPAHKYDFKTEGRLLKVWGKRRKVILEMELEPPGKISIKALDMRIGNAHILASDKIYLLGRRDVGGDWHWVHANLGIIRSSPCAAAFEFTSDQDLEWRDQHLGKNSQELRTSDGMCVINAFNGILIKQLGIAIGANTGSHQLAELAIGKASVKDLRKMIRSHPDKVCEFISTGKIR
jgi:hypothetical protein